MGGLLSLLSTIIGIVAKLFGVGQPDPEAQGEKAGEAKATAAAATQSLKDTDKTDAAAQVVDSSLRADPSRVRQPDANERPFDPTSSQ